jgi:signal transduction histidine kinase
LKSIITYTTPKKFSDTFKEFYADLNIKQVKLLSLILFAVTIITQLIGFLYEEKITTVKVYNELYLLNYIKLIGSFIFFLLSTIAIKASNWSYSYKRNLTISFILYVLLIALSTSYIVSSYNTKNTLTIFLIGVVAVSLFFITECKHIITISIFISIVFLLSVSITKISFEDKFLNAIVGLVIGIFLISLSRFNYFYKSQNFIKIKELEEKNIEIERLNTEKNDILNFVAHDLRNPLNNIEALSNLMVLSENNNNEAELIAASTKQAKEIINDLLIGVKSNSNYAKTNLSENLTSIKQKWLANTKRNIEFTDYSKKNMVNINPSKLERVIDNLISNSIKFSEDDQPITIALSNTANEVCIKIEDFGIGIPKDLQKNVFDQFSTSGREGLKGEKSTGLGLHISKKIIEEHQGQLLMTSEENKGTNITIILPLA